MAFRDILVREVTFEHPYPKKEELNVLLKGYGIHNQEYAYRMSKIAVPDDVSVGPSYKEIQERMSFVLRLKQPAASLRINKYQAPRNIIDDVVLEQQSKLLELWNSWNEAFVALGDRLLSCLSGSIADIDDDEFAAIIGFLLNDKGYAYDRLNLVSDEDIVTSFNACHGVVYKDLYISDLQEEVKGVLVNTIELKEYCQKALSQSFVSNVSEWEEGIRSWCSGALSYMTVEKIVNEFELELLSWIKSDEPYRRYLIPQPSLKGKFKYPESSLEYKYILGLSIAREKELINNNNTPPLPLAAQYLYYIISGNPIAKEGSIKAEEASMIHDLLVLFNYIPAAGDIMDKKDKYDRVKRHFRVDKKTGLYEKCNFSSLIPASGERYEE